MGNVPNETRVGARLRRGYRFMPEDDLHPVPQECCLELPLSYDPDPRPVPALAVLLHAFHLDLLPEIKAYIGNIPFPADLFISTDTNTKRAAIATCFAAWAAGSVEIRIMPNRGRDVAPKLIGFAAVHDRYDYVLHLHTKRSPHDSKLAGWRGYLLESLLGSPDTVRGVFESFARAPRLGMLAPQHIEELRPWIRWGDNYDDAHALAGRMGVVLLPGQPIDFPAGSMFWARSDALRCLLDLKLSLEDFPQESGQTDGTLAHAIERLYYIGCERAGFDWMKISARDTLHNQQRVVSITSPQRLRRLLANCPIRLIGAPETSGPIEHRAIVSATPPRPKRLLHALWRDALGDDVVLGGKLTVLLIGEAATHRALITSSSLALRNLPETHRGAVLSQTDDNEMKSANLALARAFAAGADLVLLVRAPGLLHPAAAAALLRMSCARAGRALIGAANFPDPIPRQVDSETLRTPWVGSPAFAMPRAVFEVTGGLDENLPGPVGELDLCWRAQALGLAVLQCPRALFFAHAPAELTPLLPDAGYLLATKWRSTEAAAYYAAAMRRNGTEPGLGLPPLPPDWLHCADFSQVPGYTLTAVSTP